MSAVSANLICIPTFNERENISSIVQEILTYPDFDILIIDDNSPDGTGEVARLLSEKEPRVHVLHRTGREGLGRAYIAGFKWALEQPYERIFEMDADFSHQPRYLPQLLEASMEADVVLGSRYVRGGGTVNWGLLRKVISRGGSLYARTILNLPYTDLTGGFKCFRRQVLETIALDDIKTTGYAFQIEMTARAHAHGFRIKEVPIVFYDRIVGQSKMGLNIVVEAVWKVWLLRSSVQTQKALPRQSGTN